jgi:hypothetical protein
MNGMREIIRGVACLAILFFSGLPIWGAEAPPVWRWSNPLPHGNNISDMAYTNSFWIHVAERGQVYTSADLNFWTSRETGTRNSLRAVTFFNDKFVITGEAGTVLVGDSTANLRLISLPTTDWLEGVAASSSLLVAVGDNGAIYTSGNGLEWQRVSVGFTTWLRSVAHGTPLGIGLFVAVGENGFIATSLDGKTWQQRASTIADDLNRVVWTGSQFWAVGNNGRVLTSTAGINWQLNSAGVTNTLNSIFAGPNAKLIVGDETVLLQEGRGNWSNELDSSKPLPPPVWTYLSAVSDGEGYLIGGRTGMLVEGFKTNSTTSPTFWLPITDSLRNWLWDVKRFPELYIAVGDRATIMTSSDGVDWNVELPPSSTFDSVLLGVGGRTNLAVVVGSGGTILTSPDEKKNVVSTNSNGALITNTVSTLGIFWQAVVPRPTTVELQGVTTFENLLVVSGAQGTILTSVDGTNWIRRVPPTSKFLSSIESFPGGLVAVGDDGIIVTSRDAIDWAASLSQTTNWIYRVRYLGGKLIAVGQNGTILTSSNAITWTKQSSGTTRWLNDVQWVENSYYVVGNQGTVLASTNAIQWRDVGTITSKSLYSAATHNGKLVMVGIEGVILRSQIKPIVSPIRFIDFPRRPSENLFLLGGEPDQRFTLDRSTDLFNWQAGPPLELLDSSGTTLFLDNRTNAPAVQFFRATPVK